MKHVNVFAVAAAMLSSAFTYACLADTTTDPAPAAAAGAPHACKQDIQALCQGVQRGEGRIAACMRAHAKELSAGCKEAIREKHHATAPEAGPAPASPPPSPPK